MRRGHEAGRKGVSGRPPPPPPGAVRGSACGCRAFLVEFCGPGRTDSPGAGLWGRQVPLLTDGCAVQGCGAPALGSAQPGPALTAGPRPHLWAPPPQDPTHDAPTRSTTQPCSPRSPSARRAEGRCGAGRCGMGMRGDGRTGDGTGGRAAGAGRGREGGWVGGCARGSAWPRVARLCASLRARVRGLHTRVRVRSAGRCPWGCPRAGLCPYVPGTAPVPTPAPRAPGAPRVSVSGCAGPAAPALIWAFRPRPISAGGPGPTPPTPPPRRVPPGLSRSRRRSALLRRRRAMSSSQFNKGPSYGLSAEVKNRVSGAGGGGMPGPAGVCQRRSPGGVPRVPMPSGRRGAGSRGAGGAGAALRSWGALTLPRGAPRGLGGVPGTGCPHSLPGPIPCGVSGAMAPAPCSSAPEVSLLSAFPPLCVPRGAAPTQSCPWWTPGLGLGPAVGLGGDRGTRLLCWVCLHSKRMRGAAGRAAFPPSEQGWVPLAESTARAVPHSCSGNGVQPWGGAAAPSPSLCTTAPRAALGWGQRLDVQPRTDAGCSHGSGWALPPGLTGFGFRHRVRTGLCLHPVGGHVLGPRRCLLPGALAWFSKS